MPSYEEGGWVRIGYRPSYAIADPAERLYTKIEEDLTPDNVGADVDRLHQLVLDRLHGIALAMEAERSRRAEMEVDQ